MSGGDDEIDVRIVATADDFSKGVRESKDALKTLREALVGNQDAFKQASADIKRMTEDLRTGKLSYDEFRKSLQAEKNLFAPIAPAAKEMTNFGHGTAGVTRELLVLGHEAVSGNFSRIPGSLMVLASRMGGLSFATLGVAGGLAAAGYAVYEFANRANEAAANVNRFNVTLDALGKSGQISGKGLEEELKALERTPGVTKEAAQGFIDDLARARGVGGGMMHQLTGIIADFAAATGMNMQDAGKALIEAFSEPEKAAAMLQKMFNDSLDPSILATVASLEKQGQHLRAQAVLFDLLSDKVRDANEKALSPMDKILHSIGDRFRDLGYAMDAFSARNPALGLGQLMDHGPELRSANDVGKPKTDEGEKQREANVETQKAIDLAKQFPGVMETRIQLTQRLTDLQKGLANVTDQEARKAIQSSIQRTRQEMANLNDLEIQKKAQTIQSQRQLDEQSFEIQSQMIRANSDLKRAALQDDFTAQQQVTAQEFAALRAAKQREWEVIRGSFDQQLALYNRDSVNYNRIHNEKLVAERKFQLEMTRLEKERVDKSIQDSQRERAAWTQRISGVESAFSGSIKGMITGQETLGQAGLNVLDSLLGATVDFFAQKAELWLMDAIFGKATEAAMGESVIGGHAAEAGAAAYASTAAIPFVGPELAPAAAASAYAGAMAFSGLLPLAVGAYEIPKDMPAMLHAGEAVVPKTFAEGMRQNGGFGSGGGNGGATVHINISAMDGASVARMLKNNSGAISDAVAKGLRQNHRGLNKQMKSRV